MSLGDELAATLPELRAQAESMMRDSCVITRAGEGRGPWNPDMDDYDPPTRSTVYAGPCQVKTVNAQEASTIAGEADIDTTRAIVKLPISTSPGINKDDDIEVTAAVNDPDLLGRHFTVVSPNHQTFATARRLPCVEVV